MFCCMTSTVWNTRRSPSRRSSLQRREASPDGTVPRRVSPRSSADGVCRGMHVRRGWRLGHRPATPPLLQSSQDLTLRIGTGHAYDIASNRCLGWVVSGQFAACLTTGSSRPILHKFDCCLSANARAIFCQTPFQTLVPQPKGGHLTWRRPPRHRSQPCAARD